MYSENPEKVICDCSGTTVAKVVSLTERGINTLDDIASMTGACTGCGSCDAPLLDLLKELAAQSD